MGQKKGLPFGREGAGTRCQLCVCLCVRLIDCELLLCRLSRSLQINYAIGTLIPLKVCFDHSNVTFYVCFSLVVVLLNLNLLEACRFSNAFVWLDWCTAPHVSGGHTDAMNQIITRTCTVPSDNLHWLLKTGKMYELHVKLHALYL